MSVSVIGCVCYSTHKFYEMQSHCDSTGANSEEIIGASLLSKGKEPSSLIDYMEKTQVDTSGHILPYIKQYLFSGERKSTAQCLASLYLMNIPTDEIISTNI